MSAQNNELRLQLQKIDDETAKISWFDANNGDFSYRVALPHITQAAAAVREKLNALVQNFVRAPESKLSCDAMYHLLTAGHDLFEALFLATSDRDIAMCAKETYIEFDTIGELDLTIKVDPALTYPFALTVPFERDFDELAANLTAPHNAFWGLRHNLSISAFGAGISRRKNVELSEYRAIAAVNREIFDTASASVTEEEEKCVLEALRELWGTDLTFTFRDFTNAIKVAAADPRTKLRIAYLYGHASGDRFQLSPEDQITASVLATRLGDNVHRAERQHTFLFLNGCDTAAEGDRFSFTDLLRYPNMSGLIGTEVRVPDRFAFRFALAFFRLVISEGHTFRDAIGLVRREHLPISLVYALYATDGVSLAPHHDERLQMPRLKREVNFSVGKVKCNP